LDQVKCYEGLRVSIRAKSLDTNLFTNHMKFGLLVFLILRVRLTF